MRIVVNDIAASYGGALTILKQFYNFIRENDTENEWIFLLSDRYIEEADNIKVIINKEVKKSGLHKIYFDCISGRKFINSLNPDVVFSLQNIITFGVKAPQYTYIHQSIPYQNIKKFSFFNKKEVGMAFCQYIIGFFINMSAKQADGVVVQTQWMKDAVVKKTHIDEDKVLTAFPDVDRIKKDNCTDIFHNNQFFYPTNNEIYKNVSCIVNACDILKRKGIKDFKVYLTLAEKTIAHDNIECIGYQKKDDLFKMYASSVLLFPSYIETIGLPLLEAQSTGTIILVSDCPYSREAVGAYNNAYFFNPFNPEKLADLMCNVMTNDIKRNENYKINNFSDKQSSWGKVLKLLIDRG